MDTARTSEGATVKSARQIKAENQGASWELVNARSIKNVRGRISDLSETVFNVACACRPNFIPKSS